MSANTQAPQDGPTVFSTYEIDFMLSLKDTSAGGVSREQLGIERPPRQAREHVTSAVTAGLLARDKVRRSRGGEWVLGEEAQVTAGTLTTADRWLSLALAHGDAMRVAFIVKSEDSVIMLTQDELDTLQVSSLPDPDEVARSVADIATSFLGQGTGRTVSLRRTGTEKTEEITMMFHVEDDGAWKLGHLPLDDDGVLTVSDVDRSQVLPVITKLWDDGDSVAPPA